MSRAREQEWLRSALDGLHQRNAERARQRAAALQAKRDRAAVQKRRAAMRVYLWGARFTLRPGDLRLPERY